LGGSLSGKREMGYFTSETLSTIREKKLIPVQIGDVVSSDGGNFTGRKIPLREGEGEGRLLLKSVKGIPRLSKGTREKKRVPKARGSKMAMSQGDAC